MSIRSSWYMVLVDPVGSVFLYIAYLLSVYCQLALNDERSVDYSSNCGFGPFSLQFSDCYSVHSVHGFWVLSL